MGGLVELVAAVVAGLGQGERAPAMVTASRGRREEGGATSEPAKP